MKKFLICLIFLSSSVSAQPFIEKKGLKFYRGVVQGKPSADSIREDFMKGMPGYRSCHQRNIDEGGKRVSRVVVKFFIGQNGKSYDPSFEGDAPKSVSDCIVTVLSNLHFDPYTDPGVIEVTQPINFKTVDLDKK